VGLRALRDLRQYEAEDLRRILEAQSLVRRHMSDLAVDNVTRRAANQDFDEERVVLPGTQAVLIVRQRLVTRRPGAHKLRLGTHG
jgi:hypothetical protein